MGRKQNQAKKNDEVCTPAAVFEPVLSALNIGRFSVDLAGHPKSIVPATRTILLPKYRGAPSRRPSGGPQSVTYADALSLDWLKWRRRWLNPPYSQLQYYLKYPWLERLGRTSNAVGVALLPARTSTGWWHTQVLENPRADLLVQLRGRVKHHGEKNGAPFHQVLVAYNLYRWWRSTAPGPYRSLRISRIRVLDRWRDIFRHGTDNPIGHVTCLHSMRSPDV